MMFWKKNFAKLSYMMERARSNRSQTFRVTGRDLENAILKKNYSSTSSSQPYDCAIVIEKFLEEFSKQQAKVETKYLEEIKVVTNELAEVKMKHSEELAKVEKEHFVEVNAVKLELADVKVFFHRKKFHPEICRRIYAKKDADLRGRREDVSW